VALYRQLGNLKWRRLWKRLSGAPSCGFDGRVDFEDDNSGIDPLLSASYFPAASPELSLYADVLSI